MSEQQARPQAICLRPDETDIRMVMNAELPACPFCGGTPATFTRYFEHSGIYQSYVHCSRCMSQIFVNARDREEARQEAIAAWKRRAPSNPVGDFIHYVAEVSHAVGFQAGVGGRETAGAIISYLAQHPDKLDAFMKDGVFGWDTDEWVTGGCLTWQANDGKVWHPADARAARAAKEESGVQPS